MKERLLKRQAFSGIPLKGLDLVKDERGFVFIEVLIAVVLVSMLTLIFLAGLSTVASAVTKQDGMVTAEALAISEIEYIKAQTYPQNTTWGYTLAATTGSRPWVGGNTIPSGYSLTVTPSAITEYTETDMQQISVRITRNAADNNPWLYADFTLTDYWRNP